MIILLATLHFLFGVYIIFFELIKMKNQRIDFMSFVMIFYSLFFGIAPALLHGANIFFYKNIWTVYTNYNTQHYFIAFILVVATYYSILAGWKVSSLKKRTTKRSDTQRNIKNLEIIAWLFFALAIITYTLYSKAYGGYTGLLEKSESIRGGWVNVYNPWSFLQRFGGFSLVSSYLFFSLLFSKEYQKKVSTKLGFLLSFLVSLYVVITWGGRLTLATYIITFPLTLILYKNKKIRLKKLSVIFLITFLVLYFGSGLLSSINNYVSGSNQIENLNNSNKSIIDFFIDEFSFPTISVVVSLNSIYNNVIEMRFFKDFPLAVVHLVPKSLIGFLPEKISTINTQLFDRGFHGEIPTDIISLGIYNIGVFGPVVLGFLLGYFSNMIQLSLSTISFSNLRLMLFVVIGLTIGKTVAYADPANFLNGNFCI
ncbi:O-antigen polymerase, partial [Neobacillus drentensis]|uniref:O-antigen polymerase n=1 Tax=Neobacillus drentensis TaxID=220684 RepID=UPI003001CFF3